MGAGGDRKTQSMRVVILFVHDTLPQPILLSYQVSLKYFKRFRPHLAGTLGWTDVHREKLAHLCRYANTGATITRAFPLKLVNNIPIVTAYDLSQRRIRIICLFILHCYKTDYCSSCNLPLVRHANRAGPRSRYSLFGTYYSIH